MPRQPAKIAGHHYRSWSKVRLDPVFSDTVEQMDRNTESLLEIGTIVGTHGLRGDLKVRLSSGDPDLLLSIEQVELLMPDGRMLALDISRQVLHKGQVLLRFQGYDSINQVESMVSGKIMFAENKLPKLAEDEYYWGQLNGLQVFDRTRETSAGSAACSVPQPMIPMSLTDRTVKS